jgi:single-stranded-DNA-specific exonuclease
MLGWELLTTRDRARAMELSQQLDGFNRQRQKLEQDALEEAEASLGTVFDPEKDRCIVTASRDWHQGVIGIVASRLLRSYYKPSIVISIDENGKGKGSARGIDGFSLMDALRNCREHLIKFGGHAMAAGLEIREENIPAFREALNDWLRQHSDDAHYSESLAIELVMPAADLTEDLALALARMEPFGRSNPAPLIAVHGVTMAGQPRVFAGHHLKFSASSGRNTFEVVAFGFGHQEPPGPRLSLAGYWEIDQFSGRPVFRMNDWKACA